MPKYPDPTSPDSPNEGPLDTSSKKEESTTDPSNDIGLPPLPGLTKAQIIVALERLAERLKEAGIKGKVAIVGGAALVLAYDMRESTKDVDAAMEPQAEIRKHAAVIGEELDLPDGWMNDAFKGFAPIKQTFTKEGMPQFENLEVFRPTAEMLFAMKATATRIEEDDPKESTDVKDLFALAKIIGITSLDQAREIVHSYYPPDGKIQVPTRFWYIMDPIFKD